MKEIEDVIRSKVHTEEYQAIENAFQEIRQNIKAQLVMASHLIEVLQDPNIKFNIETQLRQMILEEASLDVPESIDVAVRRVLGENHKLVKNATARTWQKMRNVFGHQPVATLTKESAVIMLSAILVQLGSFTKISLLHQHSYAVGDQIGIGGFGAVYHCYRDGQLLCIKVYRELIDAAREWEISQKLPDVPTVCRLLDKIQDPEAHLFINVMPCYPSGGLKELMNTYRGEVPDTVIACVALSLLLALNYLEQVQICWMDIKPENIMFEYPVAVLIEWVLHALTILLILW